MIILCAFFIGIGRRRCAHGFNQGPFGNRSGQRHFRRGLEAVREFSDRGH